MPTFKKPGGTVLTPSVHGAGELVPSISSVSAPPTGGGGGSLVTYPQSSIVSVYKNPASYSAGPIQTTPIDITFAGSGQGTGTSLLVPDTLWQGGAQDYRTSHVFRDGSGNLVIRAALRNDATDSDPNPTTATWVSGHLQAQSQWTMGYGLLEVTAKMPANGPGLVPAIWTLGIGYPNCMEFDILETNTDFPNSLVVHYVPHVTPTGGNPEGLMDGGHTTTTIDTAGSFHRYWWYREPNHVQMGVDNITTLDMTPSTIQNAPWSDFEQPQYLIMNVAVNFFGNPVNGSTTWPGDMLVNRVKYTPLTT